MKTKSKQTFFFVGFIMLLFFASAVHAKSHNKNFETAKAHREKVRNDFIKELNLTAEQQELFKKHRTEHMGKMKDLMEQKRLKEKELKQELEKQDTDKNKIDVLITEITVLEKNLLEERVQGIMSMKKTLTQEQFTKFKARLEAKREKTENKEEEKE